MLMQRRFRFYFLTFLICIFSLIIVWFLGKAFINNLAVNIPKEKSYRIYLNSGGINAFPIYILQIGVYNDIITAEKEARAFSKKGIVTFITNYGSYRLITDVSSQKDYILKKKELLEKQGVSLLINKSIILNEKQYLLTNEKDNLHKQLNQFFTRYTQWLKNNEEIWISYELSEQESSKNIQKIQYAIIRISEESSSLEDELDKLTMGIKEKSLRDKLSHITKATKDYTSSLNSIRNNNQESLNLAKGHFLACWDSLQNIYVYLSDENKLIKYSK